MSKRSSQDSGPAQPLLSTRWPFRALLKLIPLQLARPLRYELQMARVRAGSGRQRRRYRAASGLLLNVGCGDQGKPGWTNIDGFAAASVDCVFDCRRSLPFPDGSARGIFTEHFLEHIDYWDEAPQFLAECYRVLMPGGVIRIIVPDGEKYLDGYMADGWEPLKRISPYLAPEAQRSTPTFRTKMEVVNWHFRQGWQHRFAYDYATLEVLLSSSGFAKVWRAEFGQSALADLAIDMPERRAESLYVEAQKG